MSCVSIDLGTHNIVSVRKRKNGKLLITRERNAFIYVGKWNVVKNSLARTGISYTKIDDKVYIIGNDAFNYANVFSDAELRRPMALGTLNPKEKDALPIMSEIISSVLGKPKKKNEVCVYVVPSDPIDVDTHTIYHENVLGTIIKKLGYDPHMIKESIALAYHGLVDDDLTGISISWGSGMSNASVLYKGLTCLEFSVTHAGDFVDKMASHDTGVSIAQITSIKEDGGFNLDDMEGTREQMAIISYYKYIIKNILSNITNMFNSANKMPNFRDPVKIVYGGGTSMVDGFGKVFKEISDELEFPLKIKEISQVKDPLYAVAIGAFSEAQIISGEDELEEKTEEEKSD